MMDEDFGDMREVRIRLSRRFAADQMTERIKETLIRDRRLRLPEGAQGATDQHAVGVSVTGLPGERIEQEGDGSG